jgi:hypothetical protein
MKKGFDTLAKMRTYTIDDAPEILAKYLSILNDEAERIELISPRERTPQDIKTSISCITALNTLNKEVRAETAAIKSELKLLPQSKVAEMLAKV